MVQHFDTIVLGLGAMGSATTYQLAKRGKRVLGLDRYAPPHEWGSSHGDTRITRLAIGEGAHYTPLALRSHEIWRAIERETGEKLLTVTGELILSSANKTSQERVEHFFENTLAAAPRYGIEHEVLEAPQLRRRFPQFRVADSERGYYEPAAGFLRPEACIAAQLRLAARHGAMLRTGETVQRYEAGENEVMVNTDRGAYAADRLVLAAGAWLPELIRDTGFADLFRIRRQVLYWFGIDGPLAPFLPGTFPVFIWEVQNAPQIIYGFPAIDGAAGGIKIATEQEEQSTSPEQVVRAVGAGETEAMYRRYVAPYLAGVAPRCIKSKVCLYTMTPDAQFVIDRHPDSGRILIVSACSGHGFKHSAALGEAIAETIVEGSSRLELAAFRIAGRKPWGSA